MTNDELAASRLDDARKFIEYADRALNDNLFHHTVQFAQRAAELAVKALLAYDGQDVPHEHNLAKLVSRLPSVRGLPAEQQSRLYESNDELGDQRTVSIYGLKDGTPPDKIYDRAKAEKALEQGKFVVSTVESLVKTEEQ